MAKHVKALDFQGVPPEGFEIVGVVGNTLWRLTEQEQPTMYFPLFSGGWPSAGDCGAQRYGCGEPGSAD